jgi:hypothetical protein
MSGSVDRGELLRVVPSAPESARFGRPIGRLTIPQTEEPDARRIREAAATSGADIIILRYPSRAAGLFSELTTMADYEPIYADSLLYWESVLNSADIPGIAGELTTAVARPDEVGDLVRPIFSHYPSHYAANPLLDPEAALEGYVEWVTGLVATGQAVCLVLLDTASQCAGFAVIDFETATPDIRFGGISPHHRGRAYYKDLIVASMRLVADRGQSRLSISTQVHNTTVMSTWARLGWTPVKSVTTVHLVRRGLLG